MSKYQRNIFYLFIILVSSGISEITNSDFKLKIDSKTTIGTNLGNIWRLFSPTSSSDNVTMMDPMLLDVELFEFNKENGNLYLRHSLITGQYMETKCPQDERDKGLCKLKYFILSYIQYDNVYYINVFIEIKYEKKSRLLFPNEEVSLYIYESWKLGEIGFLGNAIIKGHQSVTIDKYELIDDSKMFSFEKDGGFNKLILLKKVDRERKSKYVIYFKAYDSLNRTTTQKINIVVKDSNDNLPVFERDKYEITIKEDVEINTVILQVNATDVDMGKNADIEYKIEKKDKDNIPFSINRLTGEIKVSQRLDFEVDQSIFFYVSVHNYQAENFTTNNFTNLEVLAAIKINIENVKDYSPILLFSNNFQFIIILLVLIFIVLKILIMAVRLN